MPGVSPLAASLVSGENEAPTASPLLRDLESVDLGPAGVAWSDTDFLRELRIEHERLGASAESLGAIDALGDGAACVVTGQQPGLLVGPLYTFYKLVGAVALARRLSVRGGRRVVPVYWCGSDDADFDEVRSAWVWDRSAGPFRAEVERAHWRTGLPVGAVRTEEIAAVEGAALDRAGRTEALAAALEAMRGLDGLAERAQAWVLRLFADDGLVVVDARSPSLRRLGGPLFERYAKDHEGITGALDAHAEDLEARKWPVPIDPVARRSGLFALEDGLRHKLSPDRLGSGDFDPAAVAPSVLLRPVWQDALLAPVAAVLGPAELHYHGQLTPLYRALDVRAARPALRPHAVVVDDGAWPQDSAARRALLAGDESAIATLRRARLPRRWSEALGRVDSSVDRAVGELEGLAQDAAAEREIERLRTRLHEAVRHAADGLADRAGNGPSPHERLRWYNLRGRPQERAYAVTQWWSWWGEDAEAARDALAAAYLDSFARSDVPAWALHRVRPGATGR